MAGLHPLLILLRRPPAGDFLPREALDLAMACGAFMPDTTLLFRDAGVLQLVQPGPAATGGGVALTPMLRALREYGIERCFVHGPSLKSFQLSDSELCIPCQLLDDEECRVLLCEHAQVIGL